MPSSVHALQYPARQQTPEYAADRNARHEHGDHFSPATWRIPLSQVENNTWKESGLGDAEQESNHIERGGRINKHHCSGNDSPRDHDPAYPKPCPNSV